jgi:hypothetical protein
MIDWFGVFANSLWIGAMAFLLALISRASWQSGREQVKFSAVLSRNSYQAGVFLAGVLFCSGLALTATSAWQIVAWAGLGAACLIFMLLSFQASRKTTGKP